MAFVSLLRWNRLQSLKYRLRPDRMEELSASVDDGTMSTIDRPFLSALAVVGASLLLGGLTSWAQGALPDALASFANSPSGWTVPMALLVAAARPSLA